MSVFMRDSAVILIQCKIGVSAFPTLSDPSVPSLLLLFPEAFAAGWQRWPIKLADEIIPLISGLRGIY
jgi:hypothetical protein